MRSRWWYLDCPVWIFSKLLCSYQGGVWLQLHDYIELFPTLEWKMHLMRIGAQQVLVAMATVLWRLWISSILACGQSVVKICSEHLVPLVISAMSLAALFQKAKHKFIFTSKLPWTPRSKGRSWELNFKLTKFKLISYMSKQGNAGFWSCEWDFSHGSRRHCRHRSVMWWLQPYKTLEKLQQAVLHTLYWHLSLVLMSAFSLT